MISLLLAARSTGEIEEPIRSELFSVERLEQHAESLARDQKVTDEPRSGRALLPRLEDNARVLLASYRVVADAIRDERAITPAAEWLVDNFHIVEDQIRQIREDLPRGFYRELPKLAAGHLEGYPRIFGVAWAFVAHTDSRFEPETLVRFIRAYQAAQPLTIGELWAVAITIRIVLVENLRRIADRIVLSRDARHEADALADGILGLGKSTREDTRPPAEVDATLARLERQPLPRQFAVQLVQRLREQDPDLVPALRWLDQRLAAQGTSSDEIVRLEHNRQAATNVTVRNVITSMRLMSEFDWKSFFESVSLVDEALRSDTDFAAFDFHTRDRYRHAIEDLAKRSRHQEIEVTTRVVALTKQAAQSGDDERSRRSDPGYHLLFEGRRELERELGYRVALSRRLSRAYRAAAMPAYLGTVLLLIGLALYLPLLSSAQAGATPLLLLLIAALALVPASDLAIALTNRSVVDRLDPRRLSKLELRAGVPADLRTLVAIPALLTSNGEVEDLVDQLELHYLANPEDELRFALLSDWIDAASETLPEDEALIAAAASGIARLNEAHGAAADGSDRFLLFHRARRWNEREGRWMGWERKRGKLHELNRLLRGATDTTFLDLGGGATAPRGIRYVITLDADTRLPVGSARALIGTMAHPANRAHFDPRVGRVVGGYGVLQPRVTPTLPEEKERTLYHRITAGRCGIDPYAAAASDLYQDLFGEGSYTGKGIYDVDAFEAALAGRVPENALLSHDLFEGTFARAGLVSDTTVFEEFPSSYAVAMLRAHRWARGDWQLLPWICGWPMGVQGGGGRRSRVLPALGRWKMIDNLRRTLSAPLALATLVAAWLISPLPASVWTAFILVVLGLPPVLPILLDAVPSRRGISKRSHLLGIASDLSVAFGQWVLAIIQLAHQAGLMLDAIVRTLYRLSVRRRLLEWVTAAQVKSSVAVQHVAFTPHLAAPVAIALGLASLVFVLRPESWPNALPLLALWAVSPLVASRVSRPPSEARAEPLTEPRRAQLRLVARRGWRFFESFVGADDNALPPDNFQEDPKPVVAHRTSPTNIGLYLLATVAARDFGWIGLVEMVERLEATLETLARMERFRGHHFNWYDTRDLRPLEPRYVSSVDSGNLAGHLIALEHACRKEIDRALPSAAALDGIGDALALARTAAAAMSDDRRTLTVRRQDLDTAFQELDSTLRAPVPTPVEWATRLREIEKQANTLIDIARTLAAERGDDSSADLLFWTSAVASAARGQARDLETLAPWAYRPEPSKPAAGAPSTTTGGADDGLLSSMPSLAEMADRCTAALAEMAPEEDAAARSLAQSLEGAARSSEALIGRLLALARRAHQLRAAQEYGFLLDPTRGLLAIGYRVNDGSLDPNCYDLLASEARLASFVAIAKGDVPATHWFLLQRAMTPVDRGSALVSWSGSMFEYLMPDLVMRAPPGSLLEQTNRLVVRRQRRYAASRGIPWGISESAFYARDLEHTYQYSSFGVPGLGLKRGLSAALVVAPYATALAAMIDPGAAAENFERLEGLGACGACGFYEALDFTAEHLSEGESMGMVRAYMAHHQGMSIVALANVLCDGVMRARFHAEAQVRAADLLLQERPPRDVAVARPRAEEVKTLAHVRDLVRTVPRRFTTPHESVPRTHLLSNGRYAVMMTTAGSGYSRWGDLAVTRWSEDVTRDHQGQYIFLRDTQTGAAWSAGYQPRGVEADSYEAIFSEDRAEIRRRDGAISTRLEVVVSAENDAEARRVSITNHGSRPRDIELTSYVEIVLAPPAADAAHPVFSKLFVRTEVVPELNALLATRRPRSPEDPAIWAAHVVSTEGVVVGGVEHETDRARFLGHGRGIRTPASVIDGRPLSNTVGAVLDPIFSLRVRVRLAPGSSAHVTFSTMVAGTREDALDLADKFHDPAIFDRVVTLARTAAQIQLRHLGVEADEAHLFQRLANRVLYADPSLRPPETQRRASGGARALWPYGISGDMPIVLVRIDQAHDQEIVRQLLRAHEYWRLKQLAVDLVLINEQGTSYAGDLQAALETLVRTSQSRLGHPVHAPHGDVFILRGDRLSPADRLVLQSAARAVLLSRHGTLDEQVARVERSGDPAPPTLRPALRPAATPPEPHPPPRLDLEFWNGLGGFDAEGREYVTVLGEGQWTPAPWINVVANSRFGFHVSECGSGYTWSTNSRENQLTAWSNDPVTDPPSEVFYVRDEESGELWGPTALPIREEACHYVARHGQGYSRFEHTSHGIALDLLQLVPIDDAIKVSRLVIENRSNRRRRLSVTAYVEWVLGVARSAAAAHLVTERDPASGALYARNPWNVELPNRVAFLDLAGAQTAWTCDRMELLGRNGTLDHPGALELGIPLMGRAGAGIDPCGALQTIVELRPGASATVVCLLGEGATVEEAAALVTRYRAADPETLLRQVVTHWDSILGAIQVTTPERSMDVMLNRWLLYQVLVCRVWARSAFYQAGGAFGFRDQLQDVMALAVAKREVAREHLLRAASRQFVEGDVQHWWHPPSGRGTRTRVSDARLWLPFAAAHYLDVTQDGGLLEETVAFLEGPPLAPEQDEAYFEPKVSEQTATFFEHCARAIDRSLEVGSHGLPLIGSGDWNDGMNRVGHEGKGESVWLAWFLHATLARFAAIAAERGEPSRADRWRRHMATLAQSIESHGWDGDWYRRAYFDDGTPLGSASNRECSIDSIAQSWAVLSGAGDPSFAARAMAAVEEHLVRRGDGLILLFTPPFDHPDQDPGYIQSYPPGVRENGGQYTHAALWSVIALAALGDGDRAGELFTILNPISHGSTRAGVHRYKVEPYVVAADIYSQAPHIGRGGWTWYTGAAGWMYRAGIEWILGFRVRGGELLFDPCIPRAWPGFEITFRYHSSRYEIAVENPQGVMRGVTLLELDGAPVTGTTDGGPDAASGPPAITLVDDGATHEIRVVLG